MFILFKITRFKRKKILGGGPLEHPPPLHITKTLNNAKTINSNMFWRVENSEKRSYLWKDIALKAVTIAKLDFDHTYAEYTLKRPPSYFVFCLSNFFRRLDPLWRKFLDLRLSYIEQSLKTYPLIYWSFLKRFIYDGHPKNNESCRISREPWYVAYWNFTCLWYRFIHTFDTKMKAMAWRHTVWRHSDWRHILDFVRGLKVYKIKTLPLI